MNCEAKVDNLEVQIQAMVQDVLETWKVSGPEEELWEVIKGIVDGAFCYYAEHLNIINQYLHRWEDQLEDCGISYPDHLPRDYFQDLATQLVHLEVEHRVETILDKEMKDEC